jgi:hypothetical protein
MFNFEKLDTWQGLISEQEHAQIYAAAEKQSRMPSGLRRSLES